ncbi:hypothetical protein MZM54_02905 [[Brevibacterium] frigoritolerans]|nr:hypothetical protein [Peribacillus frigoritolerans]
MNMMQYLRGQHNGDVLLDIYTITSVFDEKDKEIRQNIAQLKREIELWNEKEGTLPTLTEKARSMGIDNELVLIFSDKQNLLFLINEKYRELLQIEKEKLLENERWLQEQQEKPEFKELMEIVQTF